jgi:hypothetical protein
MKICGDSVGDGLLRNRHGCTLRLLVVFIYREFFVHFNQPAGVIVNLLPEMHDGFIDIHLLPITRPLAVSPRHIQKIAPSAAGQILPTTKILFVLMPRTHFNRLPCS